MAAGFKVADIFADLHLKQDKFNSQLKGAVASADREGSKAGKAYGNNFSREASRTANRGLARFGAIATGALAIAPAAVAGIDAAAAAVTTFGSALGYAASSGAAAVSVFGALGQGFGAVALGLSGMEAAYKAYDKAVKETDPKKQTALMAKYNELLKDLSPNQADFVKKTYALKGAWTEVRKAVGDSLFKNLGDEVTKTARVVLPQLQAGLVQTGSILNRTAISMLKAMRKGPLAENFAALMQGNVGILRSLSQAAVPLTTAFSKLGVAMLPIGQQLADGLVKAADKFNLFMTEVTGNGSLKEFFQDSFDIAKQMIGIVGDLGKGLFNVMRALEGPTRAMLDYFKELSSTFSHWSGTLVGKSKIAQWGYDGVDALKALGDLIGTIFKEFKGFTGRPFAEFIKELEKSVPGLAKAIIPMTKALSDLLFALLDSGAAGALAGVAAVITTLANAAKFILTTFPEATGALLAFAAALKVIRSVSDFFAPMTNAVRKGNGVVQTVLWGPGGYKAALAETKTGTKKINDVVLKSAEERAARQQQLLVSGNASREARDAARQANLHGPTILPGAAAREARDAARQPKGGIWSRIFGGTKEANAAGKAVGKAAGIGITEGLAVRATGALAAGAVGLGELLGGPVGWALLAASFTPLIVDAFKKDKTIEEGTQNAIATDVENTLRNLGGDPRIGKAAGKWVDDFNNTVNVEMQKNNDAIALLNTKQEFTGGPVDQQKLRAPADIQKQIDAANQRNKVLDDSRITVEELNKALEDVSIAVDDAGVKADKSFTRWYNGTSKAAQGSIILQGAIDWKQQSKDIIEFAKKQNDPKGLAAAEASVAKVNDLYAKQTRLLKNNKNGVDENRKGWKQNKINLDQFAMSQRDMLAEAVKGNTTQKQANDLYDIGRAKLEAYASQFTSVPGEVKKFVDSAIGTKKEFKVMVRLEKSAQTMELMSDVALIATLSGKKFGIDVDGHFTIDGAPVDPKNPLKSLGINPDGTPIKVEQPVQVTPKVTVGNADGSTTDPSTANPLFGKGLGVLKPEFLTGLVPATPPSVDYPVTVKPKVVVGNADGDTTKGVTPTVKIDPSQFVPKEPVTVPFPINPQFQFPGGGLTLPPIPPPPPIPLSADTSAFDTSVSTATSTGTTFGGTTFTAKLDADSSGATSGASTAQSAINGVTGKTVYIDVITRTSTVKAAGGGFIAGAGTGTSDSIPAWLSNGEFVVKASSVAKYGRGMMEQINAQQFAKGGAASKKRKAALKEQLGGLSSDLTGAFEPDKTIKDTFKELRALIKKQMKGKTERDMLKKLASLDKKSTALNKIQEKLTKAEDVLSKRQEAKASFQEGLKSALGPDISQFGQTKGGIKAGLHTQRGQATKFVAAIQALKKAKFPQGLIEQVVGLGLVDGTAAARQLLALKPSERAGVIADFKFLDEYAKKYSTKLGDAYYDAGIKSAQATVDGLVKRQASLDAVFDKAAEAFIASISKKLGLDKKAKKKAKATHDAGGYLPTGTSLVVNNTGKPEPVLSPTQWRSLTESGPRGRMGAPMIGQAVIRENVDLARYERQRAFRERSTRV